MYSTTAKVASIRSSSFPNISEVEFRNTGAKVSFKVELPKEVITFSRNDEVKLVFSKSTRAAAKDLQLKVYGKVLRKQLEDPKVLRVSFYGLQGTLSVPKKVKLAFNVMDEIYLLVYRAA